MTNLAPVAGANWGSHNIPRIGQEVLIDYTEGDIDRPVVMASLYNGQGQPNAQHNQITQGTGSATGNAPVWFPGEQDAHAHPASLSGIKTQAMNTSQQGTGAYHQLVFDDTQNESRTSLQHHAQAHQGTAELNLGYLRHQTDNQRLNPTGYGAELKTQHSTAFRAGQGILISTDARTNASGHQLDAREAINQQEQSQQLQHNLADTAQKHNAKLKDDKKQDEPEPKKLPALAQQTHSLDVIKTTGSGAGDSTNSRADGAGNGGQGQAAAWSEPQMQLSSPAGITASTPQNVILSAGNTGSLTAGQDINLAAQGNHFHAVKAGISLFTYGKASNAQKPNTETGIQLHTASGKVSLQSQSDATKITADKTLTVASITQTITIAAPKHLLMTAQGAYIRLEGGNIQIHGPGLMAFKSGVKELAGPGSASSSFRLPVPRELYIKPVEAPHSLRFASQGSDDLFNWVGQPFMILDATGQTVAQGTVPPTGRLPRVKHAQHEKLTLRLGNVNGAKLSPIVPLKTTGDTPNQDAAEHEQMIHAENTHEISTLKNSRYYQEVATATSHHQSEFLPESMIDEIINENSATKA
jgi:type VI secretion system secreted protein VgrG